MSVRVIKRDLIFSNLNEVAFYGNPKWPLICRGCYHHHHPTTRRESVWHTQRERGQKKMNKKELSKENIEAKGEVPLIRYNAQMGWRVLGGSLCVNREIQRWKSRTMNRSDQLENPLVLIKCGHDPATLPFRPSAKHWRQPLENI